MSDEEAEVPEESEDQSPFLVWPYDENWMAPLWLQSGEPVPFDPRKWTCVATKQVEHGWIRDIGPQWEVDEKLYRGQPGQWLVIREAWHGEAPTSANPTYQAISEAEAADWFKDCVDDPPAEHLVGIVEDPKVALVAGAGAEALQRPDPRPDPRLAPVGGRLRRGGELGEHPLAVHPHGLA